MLDKLKKLFHNNLILLQAKLNFSKLLILIPLSLSKIFKFNADFLLIFIPLFLNNYHYF